MVKSNKYKFCTTGVRFKVGLNTDRDLYVLTCLRNTASFIPLRYRESHGTSHYTTLLEWVKYFAIHHLWIFLSRPWRWWTTLDCEILNLLDTFSTTRLICFYSFEHRFRIHGFRSIWPCLIVKVFVTWVKFHELSDYCTGINCVLTLHTRNIFGCFHDIIAKFEFIKQKFPN